MTGHRPQLDGLRALAVALVILEHTDLSPAHLPLGVAGVWLFFVLSGFLITGLLLDARDDGGTGWRTVGAFAARRFLRIFPLYYLAIAAGVILNVPGARDRWPTYAAYLTNWRVAVVDGRFDGATLDHFWSLAVEEQFYLVWPFVVLFLPRRWLATAFAAAVAVGPLARAGMALAGADGVALLAPTPSTLDALAAGALVAWGVRRHPERTRRLATYALPVGLWLVAAAVACDTAGVAHAVARAAFPLGVTLAALLPVVGAAEGFRGWAGELLASPPLRFIGRISYGVYVWHQLVIEGLLYVMVPNAAVVLVGSVAAATLSWHLIEAPMNALKRYIPYTSRQPAPATVCPAC